MTQQELDKIVEQHQHWLKEDCEGWEGMRADLRKADLKGANLKGADLERADLRRADLKGANLEGADLERADLEWSNLEWADLRRADLKGANLERANLKGANLKGADLERADLHRADLKGANLEGADLERADLEWSNLEEANLKWVNLKRSDLERANLDEKERYRLGQILKEPITGYKKTAEGVVITAEIPAGAIVFCINGSKCRTNRAKITDMGGKELLHSQHDNRFEYTLGKEIVIDDFNLMYNVECASGFHFFHTREEAENY